MATTSNVSTISKSTIVSEWLFSEKWKKKKEKEKCKMKWHFPLIRSIALFFRYLVNSWLEYPGFINANGSFTHFFSTRRDENVVVHYYDFVQYEETKNRRPTKTTRNVNVKIMKWKWQMTNDRRNGKAKEKKKWLKKMEKDILFSTRDVLPDYYILLFSSCAARWPEEKPKEKKTKRNKNSDN